MLSDRYIPDRYLPDKVGGTAGYSKWGGRMGGGRRMSARLVLFLLPQLISCFSNGSPSAPRLPLLFFCPSLLPPIFALQAIDLIDEATARVKMEKTLKPEVRPHCCPQPEVRPYCPQPAPAECESLPFASAARWYGDYLSPCFLLVLGPNYALPSTLLPPAALPCSLLASDLRSLLRSLTRWSGASGTWRPSGGCSAAAGVRETPML